MNQDLRWLAEKITEWNGSHGYLGRRDHGAYWMHVPMQRDCFTQSEWQAARDELSHKAQMDICNQVCAFRTENTEVVGMNKNSQVKQWGAAEDEFLAPEIGIVESFLGHAFSTLEEDEEWEKIQQKQESSGGDNDYWIARIDNPKRLGPYSAECEDLIELFQMTFQEGEAFKALWRKGQMRIGNGKPGDTLLRNSEKVFHFAGRMVAMEVGR